MPAPKKALVELENRFWQSMIDNDPDAAVALLNEPALMVNQHGTIKFDHAGYRKMAEHGPSVLTSFELSDMEVVFPNDTTAILSYRVRQGVAPRGKAEGTEQEMNDTSTWIQTDEGWRCVMHTETPVQAKRAAH